MSRLKKRQIDAIDKPKKEIRLWDDDPRGLGIRIKPSGAKSFFVQYRSPEDFKKRRITLGQYGTLSIEQARIKARKELGRVADKVDPVLNGKRAKAEARTTTLTMSQFCDQYFRDAEAGLVTYRGKPKKARTIKYDEGRIRWHITPLLGNMLVKDITQDDVERFYHAIRSGETATRKKTGPRGVARVTGGAGTARRAMGLLGSVFSYAIKRKLRADNPVRGVERGADKKRDRVLSPDEYRALGAALDTLDEQGGNRQASLAIRALALTGCRRNEIYALRKDEFDAHNQCLRYGDTKTGQQLRPIGRAAVGVLQSVPVDDDSDYVFTATRGDGHLTDVQTFKSACKLAGLKGVTPHTLRHAFGSVANEIGFSELVIAGLLGHRASGVTARYVHNVPRDLVTAANGVAAIILDRLEGRDEAAKVVNIAGKDRR